VRRVPDPRAILTTGERAPVWPFGLLVAVLTWPVSMAPAGPGLDASWNAGLAMGFEQGLHFGTELVFTYGPLGFLQSQFLWFDGLSVAAFLFSGTVYACFCVAVVWGLRRVLPLVASVAVAYLLLAVLLLADQPLLLAALAALALLERERRPRVVWAFVVLAASFAAVEALIKLSTGPVIVVLLALALVGARARPRQLAAFFGIFAAELLALWLLSGQSLAAVPDFLANTAQIVSGYSTAMLRDAEVPGWKVTMATIAAVAISLALVVASWFGDYRDLRARRFAMAAMAVTAFIVFKQGVVRTDAGHLSLFFSTTCLLWIAIPWGRRRWPVLLAGVAAIVALSIPVRPETLPVKIDPVARARFAGEQVRTLVSSSRRQELTAKGRDGLRDLYALEPRMLAALRGRTVAVEPWEAAAAWAYDLEWQPLPVFQNYSAYTSELDRLNAEAASGADGPERILREYPPLVWPEFETPNLDNRLFGWDPPAQARAVLCNFAPIETDERWQVLGRVRDRCGAERSLGSAEGAAGEPVPVPAPRRGEVVFVRIEGAQVAGLERLTTMLLHARVRRIVIDGDASYRLVPETAGDGLMLRGDPRVVADLGGFSPIPQARTIAVEGGDEELRYEFFAMPLRSAGPLLR
jgi:hypothetical protein